VEIFLSYPIAEMLAARHGMLAGGEGEGVAAAAVACLLPVETSRLPAANPSRRGGRNSLVTAVRSEMWKRRYFEAVSRLWREER